MYYPTLGNNDWITLSVTVTITTKIWTKDFLMCHHKRTKRPIKNLNLKISDFVTDGHPINIHIFCESLNFLSNSIMLSGGLIGLIHFATASSTDKLF